MFVVRMELRRLLQWRLLLLELSILLLILFVDYYVIHYYNNNKTLLTRQTIMKRYYSKNKVKLLQLGNKCLEPQYLFISFFIHEPNGNASDNTKIMQIKCNLPT